MLITSVICCHALHSPVDTRRKKNVHKTFRRRPGRLLNVLCTFNLRPVSTGRCDMLKINIFHYVKSVQTRSYFWSIFSCIQSEYRKIRTRNNPVFGHFSRSLYLVYRHEIHSFCIKHSLTKEFVADYIQN